MQYDTCIYYAIYCFLFIAQTGRVSMPHLLFKTPKVISTFFLADSCNLLNVFSLASTRNK
ncbi:hypothetical protein Hanom_Chr16g01512441 [Helianthus anomalus]